MIVKVLEKKDAETAAAASANGQPPPTKEALRSELLNERRNRFYASYMTKARERMKMNINRDVIAQLVA